MRRIAFAIAMLIPLGCSHGPERGEVSGVITLADGKPLESGIIRFVPVESGPSSFAPIVAGHYLLTGDKSPILGQHKVVITAQRKTGRKLQQPDGPPGVFYDEIDQFLPAEYNQQTQLRIEIHSGKNTFDQKLEVE